MHMKIGLAAAVFAAVGTFAVAEGAGEGGCGDGYCHVGTILNVSSDAPVPAGHYVWTVPNADGYFNGREISGLINSRLGTSGVHYEYGVLISVGNCSSYAGESSTSGEGGGSGTNSTQLGNGCNK